MKTSRRALFGLALAAVAAPFVPKPDKGRWMNGRAVRFRKLPQGAEQMESVR